MSQWLPLLPGNWRIDSVQSLAALNGEVTRQAAAIAYLDDFRLMMIIMLLVIPLLVLLRNPRKVWSEQDRQTAYAAAGE